MSPATSWTELSQSNAGWQDGQPIGIGTDDFYIDFLFEGTWFVAVVPTIYTESSVAAASYTEASVAATTWTEGTL